MRQRVGCAPWWSSKVLLMDEPSRRSTCSRETLRTDLPRPVVRRPHADLVDPHGHAQHREAVLMSDRILVLVQSGRIVAEIKSSCRNPATARSQLPPARDDIYAA